jgi:hypothetical protein
MAVIFDITLDESKLHSSGVNNIIRFYSDSTASAVQKAEISFFNGGTPIVKVIYPGPSQKFFYNFSELVTAIINKTNFSDTIDYSTFINSWTEKLYLRDTLTIKVYFEDTTFESATLDTNWLAAFFQYHEYKGVYNLPLDKTEAFLLKPKEKNRPISIKYWPGLPFSFGFYTGNFDGTTTGGALIGGPSSPQELGDFFTVTRLVISDGATENLALHQGPALYSIETSDSNTMTFWLNKLATGCLENKMYIKWLNQLGDYDFWLFDKPDTERTTKSLGYTNNDFNNFINTVSPQEHIGWTGNDSLTAYGTFSEQDLIVLRDLFISPKIYKFTGTPGEHSTDLDWLEIKLKPGSREIISRRFNNTQLKIEFEMPKLITRKL